MQRPPPTELEARLVASIVAHGPMGLDAFMTQALYDPIDGYYVVQKPIGARGDFTTSPEISQIFGELIGLWLAQSWMDLGSPDPFNLIELGPGHGTLMSDVLRVGSKVQGFIDAASLHLVESNHYLRNVQKAKLSGYAPIWHDRLSDVPEGPAIIVGNEFLDCMPIRQFVRAQDGWREKQVGLDNDDRLVFGLGGLLPLAPNHSRSEDEVGTVHEIAPQLSSFVTTLQERFKNHMGRALLIDYTDGSRRGGDTLQALYRHSKVHPLDYVGAADITAHVDFQALVRMANNASLICDGPVSQSDFLQFLGIHSRAEALKVANPKSAKDVVSAVERLVSDAHMGSLFSVICLDSQLNNGRGPPLSHRQ